MAWKTVPGVLQIDEENNLLRVNLGDKSIVIRSAPILVLSDDQTDGLYTLAWDSDKVNEFGKFGRFAVEMNNTYQEVPISITKNEGGEVIAYVFELSGIESLIHIL